MNYLLLAKRLQKLAAPIIVGVAVVIGTAMSASEIRKRNARRKRWFWPVMIIGGLLFIGLLGSVVEAVVLAHSQVDCGALSSSQSSYHLTLP